MDNSLVVDDLDITQLSDEDLASRLQEYGFPIGPIVDTTRSVYQRKLARLLRKEDLQLSEQEEEAGGGSDSETKSDPPLIGLNSPSSFRYDELKRRPLPRAENSSWETFSMRSPLMDSIVTQAEPPPEELSESSSFSFVTKTACVVILAIVIVLIYQNMESGVVNPVPSGL